MRLSDEQLLEVRLCDLDLAIEGSALEPVVEQLWAELEARGISHRPHVWLSDDWFSPDGVPGFALPFYLAHPRLLSLERRRCVWVEGASREACLRLARHEAGHALDTAYRLSRRPEWRAAFGKRTEPYPRAYAARPGDPRFVVNLPRWYAQSHPAEDFAETFAVWLGSPRSWRSRHAGTPALRKLEAVERLMSDAAARRADVRLRERTEGISHLRMTLGGYHAARRSRRSFEPDPPYAALFQRRFRPGRPWNPYAGGARHVRRVRKRLVARCLARSRFDRASIEEAVEGMILFAAERGFELDARPPTIDELAEGIVHTLEHLRRGALLLVR